MSTNISPIPEIQVACVQAEGGPAGARTAFDKLESRMKSLRSRKMYGVFYPGPEEKYLACLKLDEDHPDDLGFDRAYIPGGLYGRKKIKNWNEKIEQFPRLFSDLEHELDQLGYTIDATRPYIEFYRSLDEMIAMIPVN